MGSEHAIGTGEETSKAKSGVLAIAAVVAFFVAWFFTASFMVGFAGSLATLSSRGSMQVIAAGVLLAPFAHVVFDRLVEYALPDS